MRDIYDEIDNYSASSETMLDVPFVPTEDDMVEVMLNLADVGPKDVLYDLGSGDGRILIAAARDRNTRGIGIDIDPVRIAEAMEFAGWAGVEYLVDFVEEDLFEVDLKDATVVSMYLLQSINIQLRPKLLSQLRPGTRIVSHAFDMGDWRPDDWVGLGGINAYKWIVPAQVAGVWTWDDQNGKSYRLELQQEFQQVDGKAWVNGRRVRFIDADLCGSRLDIHLHESRASGPRMFTLDFANGQLTSVVCDQEIMRVGEPPQA